MREEKEKRCHGVVGDCKLVPATIRALIALRAMPHSVAVISTARRGLRRRRRRDNEPPPPATQVATLGGHIHTSPSFDGPRFGPFLVPVPRRLTQRSFVGDLHSSSPVYSVGEAPKSAWPEASSRRAPSLLPDSARCVLTDTPALRYNPTQLYLATVGSVRPPSPT